MWRAVAVIKYTYVVVAFISEKRSKDERMKSKPGI